MTNKKKIKIAVLPGDGIGRDVVSCSLPVLTALDIPVELAYGDIGWACWKEEGTPVPDRTWALINASDTVLLGAITSKPEREAMKALSEKAKLKNPTYLSPVIQLRQRLKLFANVRPCFNITGGKQAFNFCVIRENTEGLYSGFDFYPISSALKEIVDDSPNWQSFQSEDLACSLRIQSRSGLERLFRYAFDYAKQHGFHRVTLADKPNVLRKSSMLARAVFEEISSDYPAIQADILNVDAVGLWMVRRPEEFGVIVAENMFGDILSDVGAGVMGGLGFAPSENIGENYSYFEPVHGSAPRINPGRANPCAMFLTICLLLERFQYQHASDSIKQAIKNVINNGRYLTYDLGGTSTTDDMAQAIIEQSLRPFRKRALAILATGKEIVSGEVQDKNAHYFSEVISKKGGEVRQHRFVSDDKHDIESSIQDLLVKADALVISGGLGPTSDDNTRFALSSATQFPLEFNEEAWDHVVRRLNRFNLAVTESNKQQALFPKQAELLQNDLGTALGCYLTWHGKHIFMLPGPPRECAPMFDRFVMPLLEKFGFLKQHHVYRWITFGIIEGEISEWMTHLAKGAMCDISYRWFYPYLEIKLIFNNNEENVSLLGEIDRYIEKHLVSNESLDAYQCLQKSLDHLDQTICVYGNEMIEQFVSEQGCTKLRYTSVEAESDLAILTEDNVAESMTLSSFGSLNDKQYRNTMTAPMRESDMSLYIKHYTAWQISKFIDKVVLHETI